MNKQKNNGNVKKQCCRRKEQGSAVVPGKMTEECTMGCSESLTAGRLLHWLF